jgi:hypothetical protein
MPETQRMRNCDALDATPRLISQEVQGEQTVREWRRENGLDSPPKLRAMSQQPYPGLTERCGVHLTTFLA